MVYVDSRGFFLFTKLECEKHKKKYIYPHE